MLQALNIHKSFEGKKILNDISFSVSNASLNAIVGENGTGKSTLLKIIVGELKADKGLIIANGSIGYCPQEALLFSMLTVEENFKYFACAYGLTKNDQWLEQRDYLLHSLKYSKYLKYRVDKLSGGTKQKLNLSIALLHDPPIFILDEPYGGFDWETYNHFYTMMADLRLKGKCVLLVTHMVTEAAPFNKIFTLREGKMT